MRWKSSSRARLSLSERAFASSPSSRAPHEVALDRVDFDLYSTPSQNTAPVPQFNNQRR